MLVLSRKLGETIYIGDNVAVTVVSIDRGKIRLGISAPNDVEIWREEIYEARRQAAQHGGQDSDPDDCDRTPA